MAGDGKDVLRALLTALQDRADDTEDQDLKTLFREVRDELRILNGNTKEDRAEREQRQFVEEQAKKYPALRTRLPGGPAHLERPPAQ